MAAIFLSIICGGIGLLVVNDCNNKRKNKKMIRKLKKEMKKLELKILKKIRTIKGEFERNLIINNEIDNYKYKTKCHCRLFDTSIDMTEGPITYQMNGIWNDWNISKYQFKDCLKGKLMDAEYYDIFHDRKLKHICELFEQSRGEAKVELFNSHESYIVYSKYDRNCNLLQARNRALRNGNPIYGGFIRLNVPQEPESFEAGRTY